MSYAKIKDVIEDFYSGKNKVTTKEYLSFFNSNVLTHMEWKLLKLIYEEEDNSSNATDLAKKLNYKGHQAINLRFKEIAKKLALYTDKYPFFKEVNKYWWWTLLATGYQKKYFHWKLRPELVNAINIFEKSTIKQDDGEWIIMAENWIAKRTKLKKYKSKILSFFENIINFVAFPEKAYFGTNKNTINIVSGHLYLGVYIHSGKDKGISMTVEQEFKNIEGIFCKPIKSTLAKTSPKILFWLSIPKLSNLQNILKNKNIWESFRKASKILVNTPQGKTIREKEKEGKIVLTKLIQKKEINENEYNQELDLKIKKAKKLSKKNRKKKIKDFPEIPERIILKSTGFKRNQYIIIEVIERSNGICDLCRKKAPFIRFSDGSPFLEVHHIKPLSEGGKDTVENTVALCPNCHREAHYGIDKEKIKKKLNTVHNNV